jgi:hypothetical protein
LDSPVAVAAAAVAVGVETIVVIAMAALEVAVVVAAVQVAAHMADTAVGVRSAFTCICAPPSRLRIVSYGQMEVSVAQAVVAAPAVRAVTEEQEGLMEAAENRTMAEWVVTVVTAATEEEGAMAEEAEEDHR